MALLQATEIRWPFGKSDRTIVLESPVKVTIVGAWPSSRMKFDLALDFEKSGTAWQVSAKWHFKSFGLVLPGSPADLSNAALNGLQASVGGAHLQTFLREATGKAVQGTGHACLRIDPLFQVALDGRPDQFSVLDGRVPLREFANFGASRTTSLSPARAPRRRWISRLASTRTPA